MDTLVTPPIGRLQLVAAPVRAALNRLRRVSKLFQGVVIAPTVLATIYFGLIARDVYVSESHIVVRSPQRQVIGGLGSLLQGTGLSQGSDDVYSVQDFLTSRDALQNLEARFDLKKSFGASSIDRLNRFPALDGDDSFEGLLRYWRDHVISTDLDTSSSILTLTVRAFSAKQAYQINEALLEMSEDFVNKLNERARRDLIQFASVDVDIAEHGAKKAVVALSDFRNAKSVFDPEKQSGLQLEQVGRLREELIATRKEIADIGSVARDNPQLPVLHNRTRVLEADINAEMAKVAGDRHSLSSKSAEFEGVALERDFAAKRLEIALGSLEQARENAMKQQLYLERIAQPNKPDIAIEPRRFRSVVATFLLSLIAWGILSLLVTAMKEHAD
jgi:capsular polysaccharide transport system permease protein